MQPRHRNDAFYDLVREFSNAREFVLISLGLTVWPVIAAIAAYLLDFPKWAIIAIMWPSPLLMLLLMVELHHRSALKQDARIAEFVPSHSTLSLSDAMQYRGHIREANWISDDGGINTRPIWSGGDGLLYRVRVTHRGSYDPSVAVRLISVEPGLDTIPDNALLHRSLDEPADRKSYADSFPLADGAVEDIDVFGETENRADRYVFVVKCGNEGPTIRASIPDGRYLFTIGAFGNGSPAIERYELQLQRGEPMKMNKIRDSHAP